MDVTMPYRDDAQAQIDKLTAEVSKLKAELNVYRASSLITGSVKSVSINEVGELVVNVGDRNFFSVGFSSSKAYNKMSELEKARYEPYVVGKKIALVFVPKSALENLKSRGIR